MAEMLTRDALEQKIAPFIPAGVDRDEVVRGVAAELGGDDERPIERGLFDSKTLYAWRADDVPVIESALRVVGELGAAGFLAPSFVGIAVYELVSFLVRLRKNRAEIRDPGQIAVLMTLRDGPKGGMSASAIADALARQPNPPIAGRAAVTKALEELAIPNSTDRPNPMVRRDGALWSSLV